MGIPGRNGTKAGECQPVQGKGCLEFSGMKQEMGPKREAEVWFRMLFQNLGALPLVGRGG